MSAESIQDVCDHPAEDGIQVSGGPYGMRNVVLNVVDEMVTNPFNEAVDEIFTNPFNEAVTHAFNDSVTDWIEKENVIGKDDAIGRKEEPSSAASSEGRPSTELQAVLQQRPSAALHEAGQNDNSDAQKDGRVSLPSTAVGIPMTAIGDPTENATAHGRENDVVIVDEGEAPSGTLGSREKRTKKQKKTKTDYAPQQSLPPIHAKPVRPGNRERKDVVPNPSNDIQTIHTPHGPFRSSVQQKLQEQAQMLGGEFVLPEASSSEIARWNSNSDRDVDIGKDAVSKKGNAVSEEAKEDHDGDTFCNHGVPKPYDVFLGFDNTKIILENDRVDSTGQSNSVRNTKKTPQEQEFCREHERIRTIAALKGDGDLNIANTMAYIYDRPAEYTKRKPKTGVDNSFGQQYDKREACEVVKSDDLFQDTVKETEPFKGEAIGKDNSDVTVVKDRVATLRFSDTSDHFYAENVPTTNADLRSEMESSVRDSAAYNASYSVPGSQVVSSAPGSQGEQVGSQLEKPAVTQAADQFGPTGPQLGSQVRSEAASQIGSQIATQHGVSRQTSSQSRDGEQVAAELINYQALIMRQIDSKFPNGQTESRKADSKRQIDSNIVESLRVRTVPNSKVLPKSEVTKQFTIGPNLEVGEQSTIVRSSEGLKQSTIETVRKPPPEGGDLAVQQSSSGNSTNAERVPTSGTSIANGGGGTAVQRGGGSIIVPTAVQRGAAAIAEVDTRPKANYPIRRRGEAAASSDNHDDIDNDIGDTAEGSTGLGSNVNACVPQKPTEAKADQVVGIAEVKNATGDIVLSAHVATLVHEYVCKLIEEGQKDIINLSSRNPNVDGNIANGHVKAIAADGNKASRGDTLGVVGMNAGGDAYSPAEIERLARIFSDNIFSQRILLDSEFGQYLLHQIDVEKHRFGKKEENHYVVELAELLKFAELVKQCKLNAEKIKEECRNWALDVAKKEKYLIQREKLIEQRESSMRNSIQKLEEKFTGMEKLTGMNRVAKVSSAEMTEMPTWFATTEDVYETLMKTVAESSSGSNHNVAAGGSGALVGDRHVSHPVTPHMPLLGGNTGPQSSQYHYHMQDLQDLNMRKTTPLAGNKFFGFQPPDITDPRVRPSDFPEGLDPRYINLLDLEPKMQHALFGKMQRWYHAHDRNFFHRYITGERSRSPGGTTARSGSPRGRSGSSPRAARGRTPSPKGFAFVPRDAYTERRGVADRIDEADRTGAYTDRPCTYHHRLQGDNAPDSGLHERMEGFNYRIWKANPGIERDSEKPSRSPGGRSPGGRKNSKTRPTWKPVARS